MVQSCYPRPGQPIAPKLLAEVLRIPAQRRRGGHNRAPARRPLLLCHLDEKAWNRFPQPVCRKLGREVILAVGRAARTSSALANLRIPPIPPGLALADLDLESRTKNSLTAAGFGRRPQDLRKMTAEGILRLRGFWVKSLVDLLTSLEFAAKHPKTHPVTPAKAPEPVKYANAPRLGPGPEKKLAPLRLRRALINQAPAMGRMPELRRIQFDDPRLGNVLRAMDTESDTVDEMLDRIGRQRLTPSDPLQLPAEWKAFRQQLRTVSRLPLETELVEIFGAGEASRDRQIIARYFGWDGQGRRTLEALGREYGVSRERIRQICSRAIKQCRNVAVFAPVLDRAIAFLAARIPRSLAALQTEFDRARFSACRLPIALVAEAAKLLGRKPPCVLAAVEKGYVAVAAGPSRLPGVIAQAAKRIAANYGAATLSRLRSELPPRLRAEAPRRLLDETLQTIAGFRWLDARRQWFQLDGTHPDYGLPNMIGKILSVCPRIEGGRMCAALLRNRRRRRPLPPPNVLLEFCRHMPGVRVEGKTIVACGPRSRRTALADVERIVVRTLERHGPILGRAELEDLCLRAGVNRFSFNAAVMSSPVIAQYGRGVYGLLGVKPHRRAAGVRRGSKAKKPPA